MSRKPGRPTNKDGPVITRQMLLETAARLFGQDGFEGSSLRAIASEANVSLSTLQHYFKTKTVLWKAIIDELVVPNMQRRVVTPHQDNESHLGAAIAMRLAAVVSRPGLSGKLLTDSSEAGKERLAYLANATASIRASDRALLESLKETGIIRSVDIDAVIAVIGIAISTLSSAKEAVRTLVGPDLDNDTDREKMVTAITDLLVNGLRPRDS